MIIYDVYVYVHVFILICSNIANNGEYPIVHNNYGASLGFNWDLNQFIKHDLQTCSAAKARGDITN